jgi:hypothetical protein
VGFGVRTAMGMNMADIAFSDAVQFSPYLDIPKEYAASIFEPECFDYPRRE